jgi:hypothetical protein
MPMFRDRPGRQHGSSALAHVSEAAKANMIVSPFNAFKDCHAWARLGTYVRSPPTMELQSIARERCKL